ncbi:RICIN domain-containing protein [Streptosporangium sp. NPDC051022]|uniref:RICIN domain-containing protein n=1 Tax=Streptosporangium sp. NPDC051022 TaxID=3155752 RepID=UPI003416F33D
MFTIGRISALAAVSAGLLSLAVVAGASPASAASPQGEVFILNEGNDQVLDVAEGHVRPNAAVITYARHGGENQKWFVERQEDGTFHIVSSENPSLCVGADSPHVGAGQVRLHGCDQQDAQRWRFSPAGGGAGVFESAEYPGLSLAAVDEDSGTVLDRTDFNDASQRWSFPSAS